MTPVVLVAALAALIQAASGPVPPEHAIPYSQLKAADARINGRARRVRAADQPHARHAPTPRADPPALRPALGLKDGPSTGE